MSSIQPVTASPKENGRPVGKWKILLLLLLLIAVLRECGVPWNAYGTAHESSTDSEYTTSRSTRNGRPVDLRQTTLSVSVSGPQGGMSPAVLQGLRKTSAMGSGPYQGRLKISLGKADLSGAYWLPFCKKGRCRFDATYTLEAAGAGSMVSVEGKLSGHSDVKATGLCSVAQFRAVAGQEVAAAIVQQLQINLARSR